MYGFLNVSGYYIIGFIYISIMSGLYLLINNITIQSLKPISKYQHTHSGNINTQVWVSSLCILMFMSVIISLNINPIKYSKYYIISSLFIIYIIMNISVISTRTYVHYDDPSIKTQFISTIISTISSCIPIILASIGSSGISEVITPGGTSIYSTILLFITLAIPASIGNTLLMLLSKSSNVPITIYLSLFSIFSIISLFVFFI